MAQTKRAVAEDQPPVTSIRLPAELREFLSQEARDEMRSLSAVIIRRLWSSVAAQADGADIKVIDADGKTQVFQLKTPEVPDTEARLLQLFRQLSPERQLALLTLLKG